MAEDVLHIYNWNNALSADTAKRFEQSCKCRLVQDYYGDNEEMLAKLAAGAKGYDMVFPTAFAVSTLIKQGKTQPLNKAQLPNWKNLNTGYLALNAPFDAGNKVAAPTVVSLTLLGYNETQLQKPACWPRPIVGRCCSTRGAGQDQRQGHRAGFAARTDVRRPALSGQGRQLHFPADWKAAAEVIRKAKPYWAAFNNQSYIKELTVGNICGPRLFQRSVPGAARCAARQTSIQAGLPAAERRQYPGGGQYGGAEGCAAAPGAPLHQLHAGRQERRRDLQPDRRHQPGQGRGSVLRRRSRPTR